MRSMLMKHAAAWATATLLALGGCAGWEVVDDSPELEVDVAPPPPRYEVVPTPPFIGAVWVGGRWAWSGGRHVWVAGRYVRPRPGYVYHPHVWTRHGNRWRYNRGGWHRR